MATRPSSVAWLLCLIAVLAVGALYLSGFGQKRLPVSSGIAVTELGGPFALVNQDGKKVTEKSWPGKYLLLYFGFTHCPDVCPLGLNKIAEAYAALPQDVARQIQPLFITVDPERDTPAELKPYIALFHPKLIGLTGSVQEIEHMTDLFKVYAQKQGGGKDYMVNHSAFTYLLAPKGGLAALFAHDVSAEDMEKQIIAAVKADSLD
ncbi:MAG: electron transporter SenC [Alphaproteobacteria bacterium]|nr:electron transporter SenC [Alphaproteobacteria bacterium]